MKHLPSVFRFAALLAVAATGVAAFVACSSDENAAGSNDPDGSTPEGGANGDYSACGADIGKSCDEDAGPACPCGLKCFVTKCAIPAACDDALVSWTAPTGNTDGTCLRDLGGFVIYSGLGTQGGPYPNVIDAGMPCVQTGTTTCGDAEAAPIMNCGYRVTKLENGTWYFTVTAYNTQGVESPQPGEVSKVVTCPGK